MEKFEGSGKIVTLEEDKLIFANSKSIIGKIDDTLGSFGGNVIPLDEISSIQCKKANILSNGYFKVTVNGISNMETTVFFLPKKGKYEEAQEFANKVQKAIDNYKKKQNSSGMSVADELAKFKNLLDAGVITQEEFAAKKKELLGL